MTMLNPKEAIAQARRETRDKINRYRNKLKAMSRIKGVLEALKFTGTLADVDCYDIGITFTPDVDATVSLHLEDEARDSQLIHQLVKITGQTAEKKKNPSGDSIIAELIYDRVRYVVVVSVSAQPAYND